MERNQGRLPGGGGLWVPKCMLDKHAATGEDSSSERVTKGPRWWEQISGWFWRRSEGSPVKKPSSSPHCTVWVMMCNLLARKTFPGKGTHFLKDQAAGQWLNSKLFPNLTPKSEYAMVSPRETCFNERSPKDPWETPQSPQRLMVSPLSLTLLICKIGALNMILSMGPLSSGVGDCCKYPIQCSN